MFESVFQSFEKLISEFSWRRLVFLALLLVLAIVAIWLWENNTGQMRLTRFERTVAILNSLKDLQGNPAIENDPVLKSTLVALKQDLKEFTVRKSEVPTLGIGWRKGFAGGAAWLLVSFAFFPALRTGDRSELNGLIGCLVLAMIFGVIGAWLPDAPYAWINYVAYPLGNFFVFVVIAMWWQARQRARITFRSTGPVA